MNPPSSPTPTIEVNDLHKSFGSLDVINGVSLKAYEGDIVSIIGASGSGKSTFLRCLNLLENPTSGNISVNGELLKFKNNSAGDMIGADPRQIERIRTQLGMVFQGFNLWEHRTVLQNVIEAPIHVLKINKHEAIERAESLLQKVGLWEKRNQYPVVLSGGQQQRVAIARALAIEPSALLFDEPTSALDPELVGEVLKVIRSLAEEGRTMLLVTHEMNFASNVSSHVIFLHNGRVEEEGSPQKVFKEAASERCRNFVRSVG
jgi:ABC-type histidine transport system ATPase subunit